MKENEDEIYVREECFAYRKKNANEEEHCDCLIELFCKNEKCRFFKEDING